MSEASLELEKKLWSVTKENPLNKTHIDSLDYLVKRLEKFLQVKLLLNTFEGDDIDGGFCWTFRADLPENNSFTPFFISFNGVIGMELNYDENKPHYSASLFLFGNGQRLFTKDNKSYIELFYEKKSNNPGEWRSLGWQEDEFWEFEDVEEDSYGPSI